jgi:hypothetical protein
MASDESRSSIVAWLGLVIALLALSWNIVGYISTQHEKAEARKEVINIESRRVNEDYSTLLFEIRPVSRMSLGWGIGVYWDVLIINNSENTVSLKSYKLMGRLLSHDYDMGLFDCSYNPLNLPISIGPKDGKRFYLFSTLKVQLPRYIELKYPKPSEIPSIGAFFDSLYSEGCDCFGNEVKYNWGKRYLVADGDNIRDQEIILQFVTGQGNMVQDTLSWYESNRIRFPKLWPEIPSEL